MTDQPNDFDSLVMPLVDDLQDKCFRRWINGPRLAGTLRVHCMAYFTRDAGTETMLISTFGEEGEFIRRLYVSVVKSFHAKFEENSDSYAESVFDSWTRINVSDVDPNVIVDGLTHRQTDFGDAAGRRGQGKSGL